MSTQQIHSRGRQCPNCLHQLPADARAQQVYCSARCREAAKKRRLRGSATADPRGALETTTAQLAKLTTQVGQLRQRLAERDETISRLRSELRSERRRIDRIAHREGQRTRQVQDELTAAKAELAAATVESGRPDAAATRPDTRPATGHLHGRGSGHAGGRCDDRTQELAEELAAVKDRLSAGQAAYRQVAAERDDLAEMLIEADRRHTIMATVIGHWDDLAGRLHQAVAGRPETSVDAAILSYWSKARDRLLDHAARSHRRRTDHRTGHLSGQMPGRGQTAAAAGSSASPAEAPSVPATVAAPDTEDPSAIAATAGHPADTVSGHTDSDRTHSGRTRDHDTTTSSREARL